jgi:predicted Zn-dependent peptidase
MFKKLTFIVIIALSIFSSFPIFADEPSRIERTAVNGMSILLQKNKSEIAEITLLLKSGSGIEPDDKKGTPYIMNDIVYGILNNSQSIVGSADVTTEPDYTLISLKTLARDIKPTLERIKFLLSEPIYSYDSVVDLKEGLDTDLKAMQAETKSYSDFNKEYYGLDHPYNDWPNSDTIAAVTGPDVYKWYRQTYQPGNAILSISGGVNQSIDDLEKFFVNLASETVDRHLIIQPVLLNEDKQLKRVDLNGRASSLCIGFSAPRMQDAEYPAFRVLAYYLEEYQHYFEELRVKEGLFYEAEVYYNYVEKPKAPNIAFITQTDPNSLKTVEIRTLEVVHKLMENGIEQSDIDKVVKAVKTEDQARKASGKGLATRNALSQYLQTQLIYDETLLPKLELVKTEDIKKAAIKYLQHYIEVSYIPKKVEEPF